MRADIKPRVVAETENVEIIKSMVASGLGISIVPFQSVAQEIRGGSCGSRASTGQTLVRETGWVHLRADRVPRMVREMMDTLTRILPRLVWRPPAARSGAQTSQPVPARSRRLHRLPCASPNAKSTSC